MRIVDATQITETVARLLQQACMELPDDVVAALHAARTAELQPLAQSLVDMLIKNAEIAKRDRIPICQDTGVANVFVELGAEVHIAGAVLDDAVNEGIRRGTRDGYLRCSMVRDPLRRENTGDNTPGTVYILPVPGTTLRIHVAPKGAGCENMSRSTMLIPADGRDGVVQFVVEAVRKGGANHCPPVVVGVGLGGDFAWSAVLAKRALLRAIGARHPDQYYAALEVELRDKINALGLGPQALGGLTTALDVFVETAPCHIASLPVAVCINCNAARHASAEV